jgi:flavodoxin
VEGKNKIILQFYTKPEDIPDEAIPILREKGIELLLSISPSQVEDANATEITRKLNDGGIRIYATLSLEEEQGIYAHDGNVQEFIEHYHAFRNWAKEKRLEFEGILIDSEPDWRFLNRITLLSRKGDLIGIERELADQINDTEHKNAIEKYKELIDEAKKDGYEIILIGMPTVVDDLLDGDDFLQKIQGISSIPPVGWDRETFMIYRSTYENTLGYDFGSYLVYSYGRTVKEIFPRGNISIGVAGYFSEPKFFLNHSTYIHLDQISDDIIVLNGLGFSQVQIFSLGSFIQTFGMDGLRNIESKGKITINFSKEVAIIRGGTLIFDRLQNILRK